MIIVYCRTEQHSIFWKMIKTPSVRRALIVGCGMQMIQQLAGINTVMYVSRLLFLLLLLLLFLFPYFISFYSSSSYPSSSLSSSFSSSSSPSFVIRQTTTGKLEHTVYVTVYPSSHQVSQWQATHVLHTHLCSHLLILSLSGVDRHDCISPGFYVLCELVFFHITSHSVHPPLSGPSLRSLPSHLYLCYFLCNMLVVSSHYMFIPRKVFWMPYLVFGLTIASLLNFSFQHWFIIPAERYLICNSLLLHYILIGCCTI